MNFGAVDEQKSQFPSMSKVICIVGLRQVQNELIALCLKRETGAQCLVKGDIADIPLPGDLPSANGPRLFLCDYQAMDLKGLLADLGSSGRSRLSGDYVALFNVSRDHSIEGKYVREGVRGIFYEQDALEQFLEGVRAILKGELWLSREVMMKCILADRDEDSTCKGSGTILSPRETEILAFVGVGARNEEIADKLCISPHTVKTHLYNIFKKINVPNRLQAALWAAKNL